MQHWLPSNRTANKHQTFSLVSTRLLWCNISSTNQSLSFRLVGRWFPYLCFSLTSNSISMRRHFAVITPICQCYTSHNKSTKSSKWSRSDLFYYNCRKVTKRPTSSWDYKCFFFTFNGYWWITAISSEAIWLRASVFSIAFQASTSLEMLHGGPLKQKPKVSPSDVRGRDLVLLRLKERCLLWHLLNPGGGVSNPV